MTALFPKKGKNLVIKLDFFEKQSLKIKKSLILKIFFT